MYTYIYIYIYTYEHCYFASFIVDVTVDGLHKGTVSVSGWGESYFWKRAILFNVERQREIVLEDHQIHVLVRTGHHHVGGKP